MYLCLTHMVFRDSLYYRKRALEQTEEVAREI